jgi:hypothetical protein
MNSQTSEARDANAPDQKTEPAVDVLDLTADELRLVGGGGIVHRF